MTKNEPETLLERYATEGDVGALALLFDRLAPDLTRLATQLVGDAHLAEDIVQETFLTVVERPEAYDRTRPLKPWLIGILVNRARTTRRRAGRSPEPDRLVEREVATPDQELGHAETLDGLDRALAELPDSLRVVVEARLAGEDPESLAERLGVSRGALRVRLHRGLQSVRALLPASLATGFALVFLHSSGLAQVRGLVLKRARERSLAKGLAATTTAVGLGGILMTKQVMLVGVVAVLAMVIGGSGLFGQQDQLELAPASDGSRVALELGGDGDGDSPAEPAATPVTGARSAVTAPPASEPAVIAAVPGLELRGTVLDEQQRPVARAEVCVWASDDARIAGGAPEQVVAADAAGAFRLTGLGARFVAFASAPGLVASEGLSGRDLAPDLVEDLVLRVRPGASQRGIVRDPDGRPVEGALVWTLLTLSMQERATGVEGLELLGAGSLQVRTDDLGRFTLLDLPARRTRLYVRSHPYLVHDESFVAVATGAEELEITLDAGLTKRGRVLAADGTPAAGARLRMWPYWSNRQTVEREVLADDDGWFEVVSLLREEPPGWGDGIRGKALTVMHPGHAVEVVQPLGLDEPGDELLLIQLSPERVLAGVVVDGEDRPLAGVRLRAEGTRLMNPGFGTSVPTTWEWSAGQDEAVSAEDGSFRIGGLYAGAFQLHLVHPDDKDLFTEVAVNSGAEDLRLVLSAEAAARSVIRGRVVDDVTGEPLPAFSVTPMIASERGSSGFVNEFEDAGGRFEVAAPFGDDVEVGIDVKAPGYATLELPTQGYPRGVTELELRLVAARDLDVSVVDETGALASRGTLSVYDADGQRLSLRRPGGMRSSAVSLEARVLELFDLPAAPLRVVAEAPGVEACEAWVDLTQPYEGQLRLELADVPMGWLPLLVICDSSGFDPVELRDLFANIEDPEKRTRLQQLFAQPSASMLDAKAQLLVATADGSELCRATIERTEAGKFRSTVDATAGGNWASSSVGSTPVPEVSLWLPAGRVHVTVKAPGHASVEEWFDIEEAEERAMAPQLVYLGHD